MVLVPDPTMFHQEKASRFMNRRFSSPKRRHCSPTDDRGDGTGLRIKITQRGDFCGGNLAGAGEFFEGGLQLPPILDMADDGFRDRHLLPKRLNHGCGKKHGIFVKTGRLSPASGIMQQRPGSPSPVLFGS